MHSYFSQITARNILSGISSILPVIPSVASPDPFEEDFNEQPALNSVQQNLLDEEKTALQQANIKSLPPLQIESNFKNDQDQSYKTRYLLRHIERLEFRQNKNETETEPKNPELNSIPPPTNGGFVESKNIEAIPVTLNPVDEQQKRIKHIEQEPHKNPKKSLLKPTAQKKVSSNPAIVGSTITKLQPAQAPLTLSTSKAHKPASKLVIGKITVEVIQPPKSVAPRIINRVKETPLTTGSSTSTKLSFGLGQL